MFGPLGVEVDGCVVDAIFSAVRRSVLPVVHWFGLATAAAASASATSITTSFVVVVVAEGVDVVGCRGRRNREDE